MEMSRQLSQQDAIRKLKTAFEAVPEPDVGPAISAVRFQLPSGKKLSRRFAKTETVQVRITNNPFFLCLSLKRVILVNSLRQFRRILISSLYFF